MPDQQIKCPQCAGTGDDGEPDGGWGLPLACVWCKGTGTVQLQPGEVRAGPMYAHRDGSYRRVPERAMVVAAELTDNQAAQSWQAVQATNARLNRRCQRLEKRVALYRWRYLSLKNQVRFHMEKLEWERHQLRDMYFTMRRDWNFTVYPYMAVKNKFKTLYFWLYRHYHYWKSKNENRSR